MKNNEDLSLPNSYSIDVETNYKDNIKKLIRTQKNKIDFIKKEPIITHVTLTKFSPKKNPEINSFRGTKYRKSINTTRNYNKNYLIQKIKKIKNSSDKNKNLISNHININNNNLKIKNKDKNSLKRNKILNNYQKMFTDTENEDINFKENFSNKNSIDLFKEIKENEYNKTLTNLKYKKSFKNILNNSLIAENELSKDNICKNIFLSKSKSKPIFKDIYLGKNTITEENKNGGNNYSKKIVERIMEENDILTKKNELLNKEIKKLYKYLIEQDNKAKNDKQNQKLNEDQIIIKNSDIDMDKNNLIEEMKNKIFCLQKENIHLNKEIDLNKKELYEKENIITNKQIELSELKSSRIKGSKTYDYMNNIDNQELLGEINELKEVLSDKNEIIEKLKKINIEKENELKNLNIQLKLEINELKNKIKIKDEEINMMKNEKESIYTNLGNIKNDYENLYKKYIEQNNIIDQYIKNLTISNNNINIDNGKFPKYESINNLKSDHINRTKILLKSHKINREEKENNKSMNFDYNIKEKNDFSSRNNLLPKYNNNTCCKHESKNEKFFRKLNLIMNDDINNNFDMNNNLNNTKNKVRNSVPKKNNISYNSQTIPIDNSGYRNLSNLTSNYFYNKNKNIIELNSQEYDTNYLKTSCNENSSNKFYEINFSENAINNFNNIYTLVGAKIIGFNLLKKKFILINPIDKTDNIFNNNMKILKNYSIIPITLTNSLGFFILINNYIFFYSSKNNTLNIISKLSSTHWNGGFISINNENLYIISGIDTTGCEVLSLKEKKVYNLPNTNYIRINSGICNVNNEYIYALFGKNSDNSIERLNIRHNDLIGQKWELINIINSNDNIYLNNLEQFLCFCNEDNIIILGGDNHSNKDGSINEIIKFNIYDNSLKNIGFINLRSLYLNQITFIDDEFFFVYDRTNGLHFFNKDLEQQQHVIFNFQI